MNTYDIAVIPGDGIGKEVVPAANININGKYPSMFEPVHGSASDIGGKATTLEVVDEVCRSLKKC